ncbi:MAG: EamA family transporter [Alistipes sp.]
MALTAIAVLLRILSNPLANVFQKQLTERSEPPLKVNFITFLLLSAVCIVPATRSRAALPKEFWVGARSPAYSALTETASGKSVAKHHRCQTDQFHKSVVGMIAGILLLGEIPGLWGVAGIALIVGGSYFVLDTLNEKFSPAILRRKDIRYRIWAMVLTAVEAVFIKKVILYASATTAFITWCWFGALFSLALALLAGRSQSPLRIRRKDFSRYVWLVLCIGTMQYTTNYVFDRMNVGYALALFQLSTIVSILLGYKIFREQAIGRKLLGAVIMIVGSVLIIFSK